MSRSFVVLLILCSVCEIFGQDMSQISAIYNAGQSYYEKRELFKAAAEFEKVIKLDSTHRDALYKLALVNYKLGDKATAFRLLRRGVELHDQAAAHMLRVNFHYQLTYADTMQNIDPATQRKFMPLKGQHFSTLYDLTKKILSLSSDRKEQLQMLLLWSFHNMKGDSSRFFTGGNPLSTAEAFAKRTGLCEEYSNIVAEFCNTAGITNFKVPGYVRYPGLISRDNFRQTNHAWNAIYLDSTWVLCDLFWSTTVLDVEDSSAPFIRQRLETDYFLSHPEDFIKDHLPSDPVFQFSDFPIKLEAFTKVSKGFDSSVEKMPYLNYKDSLNVMLKMSADDQNLKIAHRAYEYNKDNPNDMIVENYNYAVRIFNNKMATKDDLIKAKNCLALLLAVIDTSNDEEIKSLKESSKDGIAVINRRLQQTK